MENYDGGDQDKEKVPGAPKQKKDYRPGAYSQRERRRAPASPPGNMALFSLLCGIMGIFSLFSCMFPAAILLGVGAILLSVLSRKGEPFSGLAIAGLILGILAVLLGIAECAYLIFLNYMLQDPKIADLFSQLMEQYGISNP